jgi:4-hydroxy-tetrahydrodipicolinate synthase
MYAIDAPFTGCIKEAIRLSGLDISTAVLAPATPPDAATLEKLEAILKAGGVLK